MDFNQATRYLKQMSEDQLGSIVKGTNTQVPSFLALNELHERREMAKAGRAEQAEAGLSATSLADKLTSQPALSGGQAPAPQAGGGGIASLSPAAPPRGPQPPQGGPQAPPGPPARFGEGGIVSPYAPPARFAEGGSVFDMYDPERKFDTGPVFPGMGGKVYVPGRGWVVRPSAPTRSGVPTPEQMQRSGELERRALGGQDQGQASTWNGAASIPTAVPGTSEWNQAPPKGRPPPPGYRRAYGTNIYDGGTGFGEFPGRPSPGFLPNDRYSEGAYDPGLEDVPPSPMEDLPTPDAKGDIVQPPAGASVDTYQAMRDSLLGKRPDPFGGLAESIAALKSESESASGDAAKMAMMKAGFEIAAGTSPYAAVNIGAGASKGVDQFMKAKKEGRNEQLAFLGAEATIAQAADASARGYLTAELQHQDSQARNAILRMQANKAPAAILYDKWFASDEKDGGPSVEERNIIIASKRGMGMTQNQRSALQISAMDFVANIDNAKDVEPVRDQIANDLGIDRGMVKLEMLADHFFKNIEGYEALTPRRVVSSPRPTLAGP